jgi:hypothetical protein
MITNEQMRANRYGKWAQSRKLVKDIQDTLNAGGIVVMATYTKATQFDSRHVDMFKATKTGAYVQKRNGKWDCIDYCGFRFAR